MLWTVHSIGWRTMPIGRLLFFVACSTHMPNLSHGRKTINSDRQQGPEARSLSKASIMSPVHPCIRKLAEFSKDLDRQACIDNHLPSEAWQLVRLPEETRVSGNEDRLHKTHQGLTACERVCDDKSGSDYRHIGYDKCRRTLCGREETRFFFYRYLYHSINPLTLVGDVATPLPSAADSIGTRRQRMEQAICRTWMSNVEDVNFLLFSRLVEQIKLRSEDQPTIIYFRRTVQGWVER